MMSLKNYFYLIGLVVFLLLTGQALAAGWILYDKSGIGDMYYDKSSIKKVNQNIIRVWDKTLYNENGRKKHFAFLQAIGKPRAGSDALHYQLVLVELDYLQKKYRVTSSSIYNKQNKIIASLPKEAYGGWRDIRPNSVSATLLNSICQTTRACKTKK